MLVDIFDAAPIWVWFAFSFLLGLASYWLYRLCALREARAVQNTQFDEWRQKVNDANGRILALQTTLSARDAALADAAKLREDAALGAEARPALEAAEEEARRLKYDLWVLQTRLARAGAPRGDASSREAERNASALRYQLWMTQNRLARATSRLEPVRPDSAGPIRLAAAADIDGAGLRYRNWLLARQLSATSAAVEARAPVDVAAIKGALIEAEAPRPSDPAAFATAIIEETKPDTALEPLGQRLAEQEAEAERLWTENSGLRYRNWRFATGVGEAIAVMRAGQEPPHAALEHTLSEAGLIEVAPEDGAQAALELGDRAIIISPVAATGAPGEEMATLLQQVDAAQGSAATLRRRVSDLERATQGLAAEASIARIARAEAVETRRRLWSSEWRRRREAATPAPAPVIPAPPVDPAAIDEAAAWRRKATQAEAALRALRGDLTQAEASARTLSAQAHTQRLMVEQTAADEAAAWRKRAAQAEAALRGLRADLACAAKQEQTQAEALAKAGQARTEAALTRSQLWSAEWRAQRGGVQVAMPTGTAAAWIEDAPEEARMPAPPPQQPAASPISLAPSAPQFPAEPASPPPAVDFNAPLSGVEAAALELIGTEAQPGPPLSRPAMLIAAPPSDGADNLQLIQAIDVLLRQKLNGLGVYHFEQIAFARPEELAWLDTELTLGGKVVRDRWAPQAAYWAALKRAGALQRGGDGLWTQVEDVQSSEPAALNLFIAPGALEAGREETIDSLSAPRFAETVTQPLSGAEAAGLELIEGNAAVSETPLTLTLLPEPTIGAPDDLTLIRGLGPKLRSVLNSIGIYYFAQIADLAPPDIAWLDAKLGFGGRLVRDRWIPQARVWRERKALGGLELTAEGFLTALKPQALEVSDTVSSIGGARVDAPTVKSAPRYGSGSMGGAVVMTGSNLAEDFSSALTSPDADAVEAARRALKSAAEPSLLEQVTSAPPSLISAPLTVAERDAAQLIEAGLGDRPSSRPLSLLDGPLAGPVDDLTRIIGVGPQLAQQLNALGLYYYRQLTQFSGADLAWLDSSLELDGRLLRERWAAQAEELERRRLHG